jgi:hypothetical protein
MPVWTQTRIDRLTPEQQAMLMAQGIKIGDPMGLIDDKYAGMSTKQVYDLLRKEKQGKGQGQGQGQGAPSMDSHDWESAKNITPEEAKQIERDIDTAVRQGALGAGKTGADVPRNMLELMQPKVDRREVLREFMLQGVIIQRGHDLTAGSCPRVYICPACSVRRWVSWRSASTHRTR